MSKSLLLAAWAALLALPAWAGQAVVTGHGGAVATISGPASQAAMDILNRGGNAVDAAVAAAATLGVTDPFSCGIGGGGFMLIYSARDRKVITIDHRETAPASFTPTALQRDGHPLPLAEAIASGRSVGVPGTVRGWHEALARYGSMSMQQVLQPAVAVAEQGFEIDANFHRINVLNEGKFRRFPATASLYLKDGRALPLGSWFRNPELAQTYRQIGTGGVRAFYEGELAQRIVDAVNMPAVRPGVTVLPGRMTLADLQDYEARLRQPVHSTYRGYDIYGMGLPSSGGIAIAEALNVLENYDLARMPPPQVQHLYLQASRLAFADRNAYVADGEFVDVPKAGLLSKDYARQRAAGIDLRADHGRVGQGDPYAFQQNLAVPLRPAAAGREEPVHTTHLTVTDRAGNIVSYTFTIEDWGGSGMVVPGSGFLLNNELTDFDFSGPHPNVPEAGKRPRSSMSPTLVFRDGRPVLSIGSPGGASIITTVLQVLVAHLDQGMTLASALAAPRLSQRNADTTEVESLLQFVGSPQALALESYGYRWRETDEIGAANGLRFNDDGSVTAVSEPLRHGGGSALVQER
ncbi:gamma-glutamyltranspeptidase / glutathione hydrolase [Andreprevotia lacus DSM 23236]|jgi:gamma-glutamyltranspeptidase/glutathione hydrolase|uniref:Glutathione hydrolase proenzyme n=1 Tax=Andreprevotia lacus DSM 23236 TaxID=1121001 RepID=A0A1W1XGM7_9NEIS|nr:gamma-glutamyltransferase [Andreprevotia lacus]SMC22924.1 gamma-glutamyltranspeptidase / glutathione hydrolase [Andreprevotia lacus DSM 23236]